MSFTLTYNKNGVPTPIRLPIWDALKGAPPSKPPKPKPVSTVQNIQSNMQVTSEPMALSDEVSESIVHCSCCGKFHSSTKLAEENDKSQGKKGSQPGNKKDKQNGKDAANNAEKDDKQGKNYSNHDRETYTEADDQTIISLKLANTDWKDILKAINKESLSQLKAHWKQINPANQNAEGGPTDKDNKGEKVDSDAKKKAEIEKKKAEGQAKKKQKQEADKKKSENASKKDSKEKQAESGELKSWADRYDRHKWAAAASRHFDLTGERITAAVAKKLAESS